MAKPEHVGRGWFLHDDGHLGKVYHPAGGGEMVVTIPPPSGVYPYQTQSFAITRTPPDDPGDDERGEDDEP